MVEIMSDSDFFLSLAVVGFSLSAVTTLGNGVLLMTIFKDSRRLLQTPPSLLLANLCVSDLLVGLIVGNLVAVKDVYRYQNYDVPEHLDPVIQLVLGLTLFVSSGTIVAMSFDRYVAVVRPFRYRSTATKKKIRIFIASLWVVSIILCVFPVTNVPKDTLKIVYAHTHASLPTIVLTVMYIKVFRALAKRKRELKSVGIGPEAYSKQVLERQRRMVVTILIILVMFYMTVLPEFIALHVIHFFPACKQSLAFKKLEIVLSRFLFLNSAVNPFIYAWRVPKYRQALDECFAALRNGYSDRVRFFHKKNITTGGFNPGFGENSPPRCRV